MDKTLDAFLAIAEEGNLTAAADRLAMAQPSLSKKLSRLERNLGVQLFDRLPRGMALTRYGESLYKRARTIELEYRFAREELDALKKGYRHVLRIGAGPLYHLVHAPKILDVILREFPATKLELVADLNSTTVPLLMDGKIDIILGAIDQPALPPGVVTEQLIVSDYGVIVRSSNPLAGKPSVSAHDLVDSNWIIYQQDEVVIERMIAFFRRHRLEPPSVAVQTSSFAAGLQLVSSGDFVMAAPAELAPAIRDAGLTILHIKEPMWRFPSGVWYRASSLGYPIIQRFIEVAKETVSERA